MNTIEERGSVNLLTLAEAEARTKRKISSWRRDIRLRRIPYVRLGRSVRVPESYVNQMIIDGWREPVGLDETTR
jgi:hypothetical protein